MAAADANRPRGTNGKHVDDRRTHVPLWQALEEEFTALHGPLPQRYLDGRDAILRGVNQQIARDGLDPLGRERDQQENEAILNLLYREVHDLPGERAALCLSGGGIRSATFNLGLLQGLARSGMLRTFDYLSTVSGGGYVGGWLSSWVYRHERGLDGVIEGLKAEAQSPVAPEPKPIRHLRTYSNYLSPRLGILSADAWTLPAIYVRNLILNWLAFIPLLLAALMVPRLAAAVVNLFPLMKVAGGGGEAGGGAPPRWVYTLLGVGIALAACAFVYAGLAQPSSTRRAKDKDAGPCPPPRPPEVPQGLAGRWFRAARSQPGFVLLCWLPLVLAAICLSISWAWNPAGTAGSLPRFLAAVVGLGVVGWLVSFALSRVLFGRSGVKRLIELVCVVVAGTVSGLALWASAKLLEAAHVYYNSPKFGMGADWPQVARDGRETALYVCASVPLVLASLTVGGILYVGLTSRFSWSEDGDREWWSRFGAWVLMAIAGWLLGSTLVLFGPAVLLLGSAKVAAAVGAAGGVSGLITILLGKGTLTPAKASGTPQQGGPPEGGTGGGAKSAAPALPQWLVKMAAPIFIAFLIVSLSLATDALLTVRLPCPTGWFGGQWVPAAVRPAVESSCGALTLPVPGAGLPASQRHYALLEGAADTRAASVMWLETGSATPHARALFLVAVWMVAVLALGLLASRVININKFSLHSMYRDRLVRAYLGASHAKRNPHPFTGLDPDDNLEMCLLRPTAPVDGQPAKGRPMHVVNITLNLAAGPDLAWQERQAESFTVSPLHCGNDMLGYRKSEEYSRGITLGTAVAISGAAVSPNMGYHSSTPVAFLLTLFNVRLGWWLGNPGPAGDDVYRLPFPRLAVRPAISEALGRTNDRSPYVYLSDGGHFENLGVYEMVRRRCRFILVSDAGQDVGCAFEDLGNAIRKIYIDMGVEIAFEGEIPIYPRGSGRGDNKDYCAVATIRYSKVDKGAADGRLVYIKPTFYGREPIDVYNYAQGCKDFPHETTADQFFSESQFESYRRLGEFIITRLYPVPAKAAAPRPPVGPPAHLGLPTITSVESSEAGPGKSLLVIRGVGFANGSEVRFQSDGEEGRDPDLAITGRTPGEIRVEVSHPFPLPAGRITLTNPAENGRPERAHAYNYRS